MDGHEITEQKLSALERTKRIDAEFYKKEHIAVDKTLAGWHKRSIADCFHVSDGNHMSITDSFCETGIPYYRGQDIYHLFIENASPLMIERTTFDKPQMRRSHLKKGDVLMSIVGAIVGNSALVTSDNPATCSCKLAIMRSRNKGITPELLLVYIKTKYGQVQIQKFKRGAAQTGLLLEDFDQLFIPSFRKDFQNFICQLVHLIHDRTQCAVSTYASAQRCLNDTIGLDTIPGKQTTSVKTLEDSFMASGRLDAEYYQPKYDTLFDALKKLPCKLLGGSEGLTSFKKSIEPGSDAYKGEGIPFVRVSDLSKYEITPPEIYLSYDVVENVEALFPKKDTILFSKDGSVGIAYKLERDEDIITSGALLHLTVKNTSEIRPDYLTLVLNSPVVQMQAERDSNGAIIQHWKPSEIENVIIPVLDMDQQKKLTEMVQKSFALRRQSKQLLEYAKQAVEIAIEQGEDAALAWLKEKTGEQNGK
jgi:restriction endonuclease S subunit